MVELACISSVSVSVREGPCRKNCLRAPTGVNPALNITTQPKVKTKHKENKSINDANCNHTFNLRTAMEILADVIFIIHALKSKEESSEAKFFSVVL